MSAIQADYRTNKHIPSRKCYQLIIEVPEEEFPNVCKTLGYPSTGENTYVAIALLDKSVVRENRITEQTEGEKLRTRAILLCKDELFQKYTANVMLNSVVKSVEANEMNARYLICSFCEITSRSELATNLDAQQRFKLLLERYKTWQLENNYKDNLERV